MEPDTIEAGGKLLLCLVAMGGFILFVVLAAASGKE